MSSGIVLLIVVVVMLVSKDYLTCQSMKKLKKSKSFT